MGFLDHLLIQYAFHSGLSLKLCCIGDMWIDWHHVAEDAGIVLGLLIAKVFCRLKSSRYSHAVLPMDEALVRCCLDVSGRGGLFWLDERRCSAPAVEMAWTTLDSVARCASLSLHVDVLKGTNAHHVSEAVLKAFGICCRWALEAVGPSSTKSTPLIVWG
ncbi:MAG: imidazoleglycerol-phosphate dehydratase [Candidatus Hodgkinia cicadicola]